MPKDGPKILKRFRNLDIDGVERPKRPARKADPPPTREPEPRPVAPARRAETSPRQRPQAPAPRPEPPTRRPTPPMQRETLTVRSGGMTVERVRMDISGRGTPVELPPGTPPGVVTIEMGASPRPARAPSPPPRAPMPPPSPPRRSYTMPPAPAARSNPAPIELTELAARQVRLMAYQHGMVGAGLRVLTSGPGGPAHCDFAFEHTPDDNDEVFLSKGIRLFVDRASLRTLRGMRITYDDLAGASGFRVG